MRLALAAILAASLLTPGACAQAITRPQLIAEAERAAAMGRDPQERALCFALCAVAWQPLDALKMNASLEAALACATGANDLLTQALALRTVASRVHPISPETSRKALTEGVAIAGRLLSSDQRAIALRELALVASDLALPDPPPSLAGALAAADAAEDPLNRALSWALLAGPIEAAQPGRGTVLLEQALALIPGSDTGVPERVEALETLAQAWLALDPEAALALPGRLPDPGDQHACLAALVGSLAPTDLGSALSLARTASPGLARAELIGRVAAALPAAQAAEAAELALSALRELPEPAPPEADPTRRSIAAALAETRLAQALTVADAATSPEARDEARCAVALRIAATDPTAARDIIAVLTDRRTSEPVRAQLAILLASTDRDAALELCRSLRDRRLRVSALLGVAQTLPVPAPAAPAKAD